MQIDDAAFSVSRNRDGDDAAGDGLRRAARQNLVGEARRAMVCGVNEDAGAEMRGVAFGVANVIAMGQQNVREPTMCLEPVYDRPRPTRRVDHGIAVRAQDRERMRPVGGRRVVAEPINVRSSSLRERRRQAARRGFWYGPKRSGTVAARARPCAARRAYSAGGRKQTGRHAPQSGRALLCGQPNNQCSACRYTSRRARFAGAASAWTNVSSSSDQAPWDRFLRSPCQGRSPRAYGRQGRGGRVAEGGGLLNRYTV